MLERYCRPEQAHLIRWTAVALFVSAGPINILLHGFGTGSVVTGSVLSSSLAALFALGDWRSLKSDFCDMCFMAFAGYACLSIAIHPWAGAKELTLFAMTLLSYGAGRLLTMQAMNSVFPKIIIAISLVGAALMVLAMLQGSLDRVGKPMLFGELTAAPLQFTVPFVLAVGAILSREKIVFRLLPIILIALPAVAFGASMVRFAFVAALGALGVLALVSQPSMRRLVVGAMVALVVLVAIGLVSRPQMALKYKEFAEQALTSQTASPKPERCTTIDGDNSIEVRKALYRDWAQLIDDSGLLGIGLDGFMHRSCSPGNQVHNTLLQVALEFGWPAAALFTFVLAAGFVSLFQAREAEGARFGLFALTFLVLMSMAHGTVSRDRDLFLFIGYAISQRRATTANVGWSNFAPTAGDIAKRLLIPTILTAAAFVALVLYYGP